MIPYDVEAVRAQFPILSRRVSGDKPLVYLDSAASSQKPLAVLSAIDRYYRESHANVHRGVHTLSQEATALFEDSREAAAAFVGAPSSRQIVFVRGTTEAANLVASSLGAVRLRPGDEVLVSEIEHHSNLVPWQLAAARAGAKVVAAPVLDDGSLDRGAFEARLSERTKIVAMTHVSNALGTVMPIEWVCERAHDAGAAVFVDGAQGAVHGVVDVAALGCDFYAFSGHKVYGPTGIGVLWGREELLDEMPPWQGGGEMISEVRFEGSTWAEVPAKFEAGTPNIAGSIALGVALRWLTALGRERVAEWESAVLAHGEAVLDEVPGLLRLPATGAERRGVISFVMEGAHAADLGMVLDELGIAVRTGHHCAQPAMRRFGVTSTARASIAAYTTPAELDVLAAGLIRARRLLVR